MHAESAKSQSLDLRNFPLDSLVRTDLTFQDNPTAPIHISRSDLGLSLILSTKVQREGDYLSVQKEYEPQKYENLLDRGIRIPQKYLRYFFDLTTSQQQYYAKKL